MNRFARFAVCAAVAAAFSFAATSAGAATVVNGDFSAGLDGWNQAIFNESSGTWVAYTGTGPLPQSGRNVFPAYSGTSAVSDEYENSSSALFQDVFLEPGMTHELRYKHAWTNDASNWWVPDPMNLSLGNVFDNQQLRVDVLKPSADPRTTNPLDILATSFQTTYGMPSTSDWNDGPAADLSAFAGSTVRLRFVYVADESYLHHSIDNVEIVSKDVTPPVIASLKMRSSVIKKGSRASIKFTADEPGKLSVRVARAARGSRVGGKCVARTKKNATRRACTKWRHVKLSTGISFAAGPNVVALPGSGKLAVGTYRVTVQFADGSGNNAGTSKNLTFKVKPKKKKR